MDEKERARALESALGHIEKQFGKGSILRLGSKDSIVPVSVISTGSISLDAATGVGGLPRGRICEIFGPESSGKTTIALQVVAEAQKKGGIAAFIDVEHALDPAYARKLGVDVDNLLVSQPDYGEQALEITGHLIASGQIDVLVVDSVAALVPKAELDGEMGDSHMGLQARLMSQALRKLTGVGQQIAHVPHLHQPDSREDRRHVRQPGDDHGRTRAEILFVGAAGHPAHRGHQRRRRGGRESHEGESGEEQGGVAVPRGRVRHHLRRGRVEGRRPAGSRRGAEPRSRRAGRGSATRASESDRAARMRARSCGRTRISGRRSTPNCGRRSG